MCREDGAELEAFLQWNHSGLTQLRASAMQASAGEKVISEFDSAIGRLLERLGKTHMTRAADSVIAEVTGAGEIRQISSLRILSFSVVRCWSWSWS
jgi:hypothetical protein